MSDRPNLLYLTVNEEMRPGRIGRLGGHWPIYVNMDAVATVETFSEASILTFPDGRTLRVGEYLGVVIDTARWYVIDRPPRAVNPM